jgi:hypothetical protein
MIPYFETFNDLLRWRDQQLDELRKGRITRQMFSRRIRRAAREYKAQVRLYGTRPQSDGEAHAYTVNSPAAP